MTKTTSDRIDETAAEIKLAALRNALNKNVWIERTRKSPGDTQYRARGILASVDVARGVVTVDLVSGRGGATRTVEISRIIVLEVHGPNGWTQSDQYEWLDEARKVVEAAERPEGPTIVCACGGGMVFSYGDPRNAAHVATETHVRWAIGENLPVETPKKRFVWGWNVDGQNRAIVAANSIAEVVRISGQPRSRITTYGSETGNVVEVATAQAHPGVMLIRSHGARPGDPFHTETREVVPADAGAVAEFEAWFEREFVEPRAPKDVTGEKLVPGTAYRIVRDHGGEYRILAIYRDAVVEDDGSLTLVFENADGLRYGLAESKLRVEPIDLDPIPGPTNCPVGDESPREPIDAVEAYRG